MINRYLKFYLSIFFLSIYWPHLTYADFFSKRRDLKYSFPYEKLRVFYDKQGDHAVSLTDVNSNQVPDQVENIAMQAWVGYKMFVGVLGYPDPLTSERYRGAKYIDINVLSKSALGMNGIAYDGFLSFKRPIDPKGTKTISFDVASSVDPTRNITPAHEMFHLIQNGATFFKTRWYTEGMARWAEHALLADSVGQSHYPSTSWPQSKDMQSRIFKMSYDAEFYIWNPLALTDNTSDTIPLTNLYTQLSSMTYTNGKKIVEDNKLKGWRVMKNILLELGKMDDVAYQKIGYKKWSEPNQKSRGNSPYIYQAIINVISKKV